MIQGEENILMLFIFSSLLIAVILILMFVFLMAYQKKMVSQRLQLQQSEVDHQKELLRAVVEVQEKERKRIASDLHDDIGALLAALRLNIKHLRTLDKIGEDEQDFLAQTSDMLDDGLENVRRISYDLLPPTLARLGLMEAIKELVERLRKSAQIQVKLSISGMIQERFAEYVELAIFRVLQELISNTLHHAEAQHIEISVHADRTLLRLNYSDDGKGITHSTQLKGLGMTNMKSRIESIGGKMKVENVGKNHFFATIEVPKHM